MAGAYDVIVAGAGPAGCVAALRLSAAGARVLLLEKQRLGRDKPCGGALTPRGWRGLEMPLAGLVEARIDGVDVLRRAHAPVRFDLRRRPVLMVRRTRFDECLARAAASAGAELREQEPVLSAAQELNGVVVHTAAGDHRGRFLLLATGAEGSLPRSLGLPSPTTRIAVGVEMEGPACAPALSPSRIVFDFHVPGGYAWAFPKGDAWNAGVLTVRRETGPHLRRLLASFIAQRGIVFDGARRVRGHHIPTQTASPVLTRGRVAVLGDAAALADAFFAEGIAQALESGRAAALAVLRAMHDGSAELRAYERAVALSLGAHSRRMRVVARGVYRAPDAATHLLAFAPARSLARRWATEPFRGATVTRPRVASMAPC